MSTVCSTGSLEASEPLAGTASVAQSWIVIEQPGPWGRQALTDSHLERRLGESLLAASAASGTTILLARHPDRLERHDPSRHDAGRRNVWIAHTAPGHTRMRHGVTADLSEIASWDFNAIGSGSLPSFGSPSKQSLLLLCTHSGRDQCCAVLGRSLMGETMDRLEGHERATVWEASHIGGHRFAPTALSLPSGTVYGRLDVDDVMRIRSDDEQRIISTSNYRGRSAFPQPLQVAEIAIREAAQILDRDVLDVLWVTEGRAVPLAPRQVLPDASALQLEVRHVDGRAWQVSVRREVLATRRAESCGKELLDAHAWRAAGVSAAASWR